MNKDRRKEIDKIIAKVEGMAEEFASLKTTVEELISEIETVRDEEQEYMDAMPESLQSSDKYYAAEAAVSNMDEALSAIQEIESGLTIDLDSVVTNLDAAKE